MQMGGRRRQEGEVGVPLLEGSYPLEIKIDPVQSLVATDGRVVIYLVFVYRFG